MQHWRLWEADGNHGQGRSHWRFCQGITTVGFSERPGGENSSGGGHSAGLKGTIDPEESHGDGQELRGWNVLQTGLRIHPGASSGSSDLLRVL